MTNKEELKKYVKKHGCQCDDCECEDKTQDNCECNDCHCEEHNMEHCHCDDCHCDENGCDCDDCECEDCDCDDCDGEEVEEKNYLEDLQRLQAEFDNYRKRNEFIVLKAKEEGVILAVEKLLPVLDSFKAAEKNTTPTELKGIILIKEQLINSLKQLGVTQIEALNTNFNPDFHNAVMMGEEQGKESHTVLEVFQDGYMYKDKVIRHSMVKVNK